MPPSNTFKTALVKLQGPEGSGNVSVRGMELEPDSDGCIEVPPDVAAELAPHGWKPYVAKTKDVLGAGAPLKK